MVDIGNFTSASFENFDIDLVQNEVGGGTVSIEQIDEAMGNNPDAGSIVISGLKQDTFEYLIKQYGKRCWWVFLAVALVVLCTDQLASQVCKPVFQRLRPCFNPDFQDLIHLPKGMAGGQYGFVSSHAANTFGVAVFLTPVLKRFRPWTAIVLFVWAFVSSYSRIYIGYHYPGDILCGALIGVLVGLILWKVFQLLVVKKIWKSEQ